MPSRLLTALALSAATLASSAAPARAAGQEPVRPAAKDRCTGAIDRRLAELGQLAERARSSVPLADAHRASILATTGQQAQGLTGLRTQVQAATTAAALAEPCRRVVPDYRVFALTRPKVHLTIAADTLTAATVQLDAAAGRLQRAADAAKAAGRDVTAAQADLDAARAGAAAARVEATPVPDAVLALQPAGYPANAPSLASARAALEDARARARAAAQSAKDARGLLRG